MKRGRVFWIITFFAVGAGVSAFILWNGNLGGERLTNVMKSSSIGSEIACYKNVPAYQNGAKVTQSHGRHYAEDGYYYGQKWQCVEYVKRFYHDALKHHMPSVWGHAADFFDPQVNHGALNPARGLLQYHNGNTEKPKPDDLIVFRHSKLGHVAIVTKVTADSVEVIQQNVSGAPTSTYSLVKKNGNYMVGKKLQPAGWLRMP